MTQNQLDRANALSKKIAGLTRTITDLEEMVAALTATPGASVEIKMGPPEKLISIIPPALAKSTVETILARYQTLLTKAQEDFAVL